MADTDSSRDRVSVERVIPAPPEAIFALLADPRRHKDIDGSGTVREAKASGEAKDVPAHLELGSKFGMAMKLGIPYSMVSTVIELEPNRRIAWQTRPPIGKRLAGGRIWRYVLEPVDGGTKVTETWDISREVVKAFVRPARAKTKKDMAATLERIEQIVTG